MAAMRLRSWLEASPPLRPAARGSLGRELVRGSLFMGRLAALAPGLPGFLRAELVGRPLQVRGLTAFAGDFPLFFFIHGTEASLAACRHLSPPFNWTLHGTSVQRNIGPATRSCYRRYQFS